MQVSLQLLLASLLVAEGRVIGNVSIAARIIGGWDAEIEEAPYAVAIFRHFGVINTFWSYYCGGSVVNKFWIISAAHCFFEMEGKNFDIKTNKPAKTSDILISAGQTSSEPADWSRLLRVAAFYNNPDYNGVGQGDLTLLKLEKALVFGRKIQPVKLPENNYRFVDGSQACAVGWGQSSLTSDSRPELNLKAICEKVSTCPTASDALYDAHILCFAGVKPFINSFCLGDSGSGVVSKMGDGKFLLIGIVSSANSHNCKATDEAANDFITNVAAYLLWINGILKVFGPDSQWDP